MLHFNCPWESQGDTSYHQFHVWFWKSEQELSWKKINLEVIQIKLWNWLWLRKLPRKKIQVRRGRREGREEKGGGRRAEKQQAEFLPRIISWRPRHQFLAPNLFTLSHDLYTWPLLWLIQFFPIIISPHRNIYYTRLLLAIKLKLFCLPVFYCHNQESILFIRCGIFYVPQLMISK